MDKYTKKVYKFLLSQPGYGFLTDLYDPQGFSKGDFLRACQFLVEGHYAKRTAHGYALTQQGVAKRELEVRAFFKAFLTKFLLGVATGVCSTVLAELLIAFLRAKLG